MDYVSALNGQQMDEALTDVALRNSEAWAVGTRNGVNVTSADETWHNNAKYYAQVAQSAIPGTYTAAVRWDIAQGLAGEAQEQARANISAGASNRNLLDNPWFTVNQRNFTSVTGTNGVYTVDRWKINNGGGTGSSITRTGEGYIKLQTVSTYISYQQMFGSNELAGKTVTMSVNDDGNIYSHSFTVPARGSADVRAGTFVFKTGCSCHFFVMNTSSAYGYIFQISIGTGYSATIRSVKLELGSYSTLANDVPPDYGEELRKCQRYFLRIPQFAPTILGYGTVGSGGSGFTALIPTPVPMRPVTSISGTGAYNIRYGSGAIATIASVTLSHTQPNGVVVTGVGTFTGNAPFILFKNNTGYTDLSADL